MSKSDTYTLILQHLSSEMCTSPGVLASQLDINYHLVAAKPAIWFTF